MHSLFACIVTLGAGGRLAVVMAIRLYYFAVMACSVRRQGPIVLVDIQGKLSLGEGVDQFRAAITEALAAGAKEVIVNLAHVPRLDSSGIGGLIRSHALIKQGGGRMALVNPTEAVRQALKITRLDQVITCYDSESDALAAFASH